MPRSQIEIARFKRRLEVVEFRRTMLPDERPVGSSHVIDHLELFALWQRVEVPRDLAIKVCPKDLQFVFIGQTEEVIRAKSGLDL